MGVTMFTAHGNTFYNEDCIEGARRHLKNGSVDLIITDPPYGINGHTLHKHYNRKEDFVVGGYVEVPEDEYGEFSRKWITEAARVLRPGGQLYVVSGYTNLYHILHALRSTNLEEINHLIWKYNFGVFTRAKYVSSHYHILYYSKPGGGRTFNTECRVGLNERLPDGSNLNYQDREDVWSINREYKPGQIKNKNELPLALLTKIIQYSSNPGDLVCDFFLGGFSTARAAIGLNRRATGFEISKSLFEQKFQELERVRPGDLLETLRKPVIKHIANQGQPWSQEEIWSLLNRFAKLRAQGKTKKRAIELLTEEFGRGRFAVLKILEKYEGSGPHPPKTLEEFVPA